MIGLLLSQVPRSPSSICMKQGVQWRRNAAEAASPYRSSGNPHKPCCQAASPAPVEPVHSGLSSLCLEWYSVSTESFSHMPSSPCRDIVLRNARRKKAEALTRLSCSAPRMLRMPTHTPIPHFDCFISCEESKTFFL